MLCASSVRFERRGSEVWSGACVRVRLLLLVHACVVRMGCPSSAMPGLHDAHRRSALTRQVLPLLTRGLRRTPELMAPTAACVCKALRLDSSVYFAEVLLGPTSAPGLADWQCPHLRRD